MSGGQGMPWGPKQYGTPDAPNLITDPTTMKVPGIDQQIAQVRTTGGQQQGAANNAAMAALQRAGVAGGSEASNAIGNIAGQTALGEGEAVAGLQHQQAQEQQGLMDALNQAAMQKYGIESQNNMGENAQRAGALSGIGSGIGSLAGLAYLFNKQK